MNPSVLRALSLSSVCFSAALLATTLFSSVSAYAQSPTPTTPHLPDMSSYDCSAMASGTTASTRHIGQVIKGKYNEWHEYYISSGTDQRLACIAMDRPTPKQLSSDEAAAFLLDSFAVGAPTSAPLDQTQGAPQTTAPADAEPLNVKPEPLKRLRKPPGGSPPAVTTPEPPPVPATKSFDDQGAMAAPAIEHNTAHGVQSSTAPATTQTPAATTTDDRQQIAATQTFPWNTLAFLVVTYSTGDSFRCSATIVSAYVVLTAGHCVHDKTLGGYITSARVYPGQTQNNLGDNSPIRPYGVKSDIQQAQTTQQWTQISGADSYFVTDYKYDIASIEFKTPFTHTSTFMPVIYSSTGNPVSNAGYPGQVNNLTAYGLYTDTGSETNDSLSYRSSDVREFSLDASPGDSGSPFFYADPNTGQRYVVGSLSYGDETENVAGGPWYDSWGQSILSGWVSWTPAAAAGSVSGLRVASIFGSQQPNLVSYLRFYNSDASAGTVSVTLSDYVSGNILATWTSQSLPSHSSLQFPIDQLENGANTTFTKSSVYSIAVRPTFAGSFQNVLWRKQDATLTNLSTCDTPSTDQSFLMNVHSSLLSNGYPSAVVVYNTSTNPVSLSLGIYHQQTGQRLGTYVTGQIPANGQQILTMATIEAGAGISPGATGAYHYNIKSDNVFTGYLQHLLNNQAAGMTTDMTESCALSPSS
jgi:V8-like Glu-specific endopeptidase